MESTKQVKVLDVCGVTPPSDSPESTTESSLPLTFFDIMWLKFPPVERVFFYNLTSSESNPAFFHLVILPKLKHSLSHTLLHFLPLAGNLTWPSQATKPIILYTPNGGVSLTFAESNADFEHLSGNEVREAAESHPYIPKLAISDSKVSIIALQITLFPNQGFSIGISAHHAILDGKSSTMFIKAWAYICKLSEIEKQQYPTLLPELTPFFDRTVIHDPDGLDKVYLNHWSLTKWPGLDPNPRSLKLAPATTAVTNSVRMTVELSREDIKKLRERAVSWFEKSSVHEDPKQTKSIHLSIFVLVYAYMLDCIIKAKGLEKNRKVLFGFTADYRSRLHPPIPDNYFGNCVSAHMVNAEAEDLMDEKGFVFLVERLSGVIKIIEEGTLDGAKEIKEKMSKFSEIMKLDAIKIGVAGSTRFGAYGTDFGWGKPRKVEITSIDRTGSISMAESKDGSGGVEVGVVLEKHEMVMFDSLFVDGLKNL